MTKGPRATRPPRHGVSLPRHYFAQLGSFAPTCLGHPIIPSSCHLFLPLSRSARSLPPDIRSRNGDHMGVGAGVFRLPVTRRSDSERERDLNDGRRPCLLPVPG